MDWTPESIEELSRHWLAGLPTAEIGRRMGITKNAVVGKVHRLGLTPRKVTAPKPMAPAAPVPNFLDHKGPVCMWPIGHPRDPDFRFCGCGAVTGKPYCAEHAARAYVPARPRVERAA